MRDDRYSLFAQFSADQFESCFDERGNEASSKETPGLDEWLQVVGLNCEGATLLATASLSKTVYCKGKLADIRRLKREDHIITSWQKTYEAARSLNLVQQHGYLSAAKEYSEFEISVTGNRGDYPVEALKDVTSANLKRAAVSASASSPRSAVVILGGHLPVGLFGSLQPEIAEIRAELDKQVFEELKAKNTTKAFRDYLSLYPEGRYIEAANFRIRQFQVESLISQKSIPLLQEYIASNEGSIEHRFQLAQAIEKLDQLRYEDVERSDSIAEHEHFLRSYPRSSYRGRVETRLDELRYSRVDKDSLASLETFVTRYPRSPSLKKAKARISAIRSENARREFLVARRADTIQTYLDFLAEYSDLEYASSVRARMYFLELSATSGLADFQRFFFQRRYDDFALISSSDRRRALNLLESFARSHSSVQAFGLLFDETDDSKYLAEAASFVRTKEDEGVLATRMSSTFFAVDETNVRSYEGEVDFSVIPLIAQNNTQDRNISIPLRSRAILGRYEVRVRLDATITNSVEYSGWLVRDRTEYEDSDVSREATVQISPGELQYLTFRFETTAYKGGVLQPDTRFYSLRPKKLEIVSVTLLN